MRARVPRLCALGAAAALALGGCGGDDDQEPADSGSTGAQGATGASAASELTAEEFLPLLAPEKKEAVENVLDATPECDGVSPDISLVLLLSDEASQADPETMLAELVAEHC